MNKYIEPSKAIDDVTNTANLMGFYTAISLFILTLVTFGIAILTPPMSGPFCTVSPLQYPFHDIASRFPRDYWWMYPAIPLTLLFVVLMVCILHYAPKEKKIFGQIGLSFAIISAAILVMDYFIQISVIQPSIINGETDGIAILTQYNPHGVFIALEEAGYLMMSLAFLFMAPVFSSASMLEKAIRWIFIISFILTAITFIFISVYYGIQREYRFEVAVITINWTVFILSGLLLSFLFKRALRVK